MAEEVPRDLRARRRLDTHHEIHRAALHLFEQNGVRETTVAQIADLAGVSSRTFFRYFASKEQAALPGQRRLLEMIESLDFSATDPPGALRLVEDATARVLDRDTDPNLDEHRRIARLLASSSELQATAAAQERELAERLGRRIAEQNESLRGTAARMIAEVAVAVWHVCWDRWGELANDGARHDPVDVYTQCREVLSHMVCGR